MAFSLGIYFVLNSQLNSTTSDISNKINNGTSFEDDGSEETSFASELMVMFWAVLNPGPDPDTISDKGLSGITANILFAIYQIILAIILLNLLIAMMNATTQKIADKKLLYWKFVRTSVWMDFISSRSYVPPPVNLLFLVLLPFHLICITIYYLTRLGKKYIGYQESRSANMSCRRKSGRVKKKCIMDPVECDRRKAHAILLHNLIKRYLQQKENDSEKVMKRKDCFRDTT